jgi:hypothetical protein
MASMASSVRATRRIPVLVGIGGVALLLATLWAPATAAAGPHQPDATFGTTVSAITPGSVNRTSLHLTASYDARLRLDYGTRAVSLTSTATITNVSGGPVDRVELNTAVARLGSMHLGAVTVDGKAVAAGVSDQTIVVPLGGVLADGATASIRVAYTATLRSSLTGSSWLFTKANGIINAYRWLPWVSRRTPFDRPNHGDPFVTPVSPLVRYTIVTDRPLVIASSGDRVSRSSDGKTQSFVARNMRDVTVTAAPDFRSGSRVVDGTVVRYWYRSSTNAVATLDAAATAFRRLQARLGDYPYPVFKVVQSAGGYGMESPGLIWIPYGTGRSNLTYLVTHETAHQWFYGLVGNDQARNPFADEAAADFVARYVTGLKRASRCTAGRLDLDIYHYTASCYYERIYIQGGNLLDTARARMGSDRFWSALRHYLASHRYGLSSTKTLLRALDVRTSLDLGATLFAPRFPSIY